MQTPAIQADLLQQPLPGKGGVPFSIQNIDLSIDCNALTIESFFFLLLTISWLGILSWWCVANWKWYNNQLTLLQRVLIIIPLLKLIDTFSYFLFLGECPWVTEETEYQAKYLIMALVTISSIHQSIGVGLFMMLSCGWTLLYDELSREIATSVTVSMGVTYLCYSAYYVSIPSSAFRMFMEYFMIFLYSYIFYFCLKYILNTLKVLNLFIRYMEMHHSGILVQSTVLKRRMIRQFFVICCLYFVVSIFFQGIIPAISEYFMKTLYFTTLLDLCQQTLDLLIFGALLYNFRARDWPSYFLIASFELGNLAQLVEGSRNEVNISEANLNFLSKSFIEPLISSDNQFYSDASKGNESNKNIILLNPSYEDEYSNVGFQKMKDDAKFFTHFQIGTRKASPSISEESL